MTLAKVSARTQEELSIGMKLTAPGLFRAETAYWLNDLRCLEVAARPRDHLGDLENSDIGLAPISSDTQAVAV